MSFNQSICVPMYCRDGLTLDELCSAAADIGYAAVEFWARSGLDDWRASFETVHSHGLAIASMVGHASGVDGLNLRDNHERIEAELRESIDIAAEYGLSGVITFAGTRNPGQSDEEGLLVCAEGLRRIAPYAEERGVDLNMELLNSTVNHPGYQCDHSRWGELLCELVGSPRVRLLYDIYHMQIMEGDIIRTLRRLGRHVGHIHTAGNPGRMDLDDEQELNYAGICRAIAELGYEGYVAHEFRPKGDPIEALRRAFALCDQPMPVTTG